MTAIYGSAKCKPDAAGMSPSVNGISLRQYSLHIEAGKDPKSFANMRLHALLGHACCIDQYAQYEASPTPPHCRRVEMLHITSQVFLTSNTAPVTVYLPVHDIMGEGKQSFLCLVPSSSNQNSNDTPPLRLPLHLSLSHSPPLPPIQININLKYLRETQFPADLALVFGEGGEV